jgi:hypothetical protein
MTAKPRRWQIRIRTGGRFDQPVSIYAESLSELPIIAGNWLRENPPLDFANIPTNDVSKSVAYGYSDGTRQPVLPLEHFLEGKTLEEGWWCVTGEFGYPEKLKDYDELIEHFVEHGIVPEKGPDYQEMPFVEGQLPLHQIKTIRRESEELQVNDMLQRGWHIIALEFEGETDYIGEKLVRRKAIFVLGHPEERAL